ncbi:MAG: hypothetical protein ABSC64_13940 [Candidatus Korobacteraceae bacterium]|jgi:hypothetical protein
MNQMVEYHTVFTVLQKSVPWQLSLIVPTIVTVATIAAVMVVILRKARLLVVLAVYAIILLAAFTVSPSGVRDMYARAKDAYTQGQYSVVEGTVTDFHPMPYSGHQDETFVVNGVQFSYSDYVTVPCFNNTASHGGPIHEGQKVRIAYSGNCILKLEIASSR